jgi:hypothetical protein
MRYEVRVRVDHIAQAPVLTLTPVPDPQVKSGTTVTIHWPQVAICRGRETGIFTFRGRASWSPTTRCSIRTPPSPTSMACRSSTRPGILPGPSGRPTPRPRPTGIRPRSSRRCSVRSSTPIGRPRGGTVAQ